MSNPNPTDPIEPGKPDIIDPDPHRPDPVRNPDMPERRPEEVPPPNENPDRQPDGDDPADAP